VILKVCTCGRLQPCPEHGQAARQRARREEPYGRILTSSQWQKARKAVKARDGERCQLDEDGTCHGRLEVHHRVPVREGGAPFDLDNLLVVCRGHHEQIEAQHRASRRARSR
jgi:5-methylcytosine-specific restriction endonuclease McrA